ncbi:MAG TPA: outer membrane beta-barrel protein [Candidatus Polarisedimenticolia bacterium]|jgi:hypothetical protein|nr:outer membrane beta-barrel protein [Candidatus Polarisedimenticolia bacterium]
MRRAFLSLALLLLGAPGLPLAGSLEKDFPLEGMMRVGPFRMRPFLLFKDTGYDDNVFLDDNDRVTDFTSTAEGGFRVVTFFSNRAAIAAEERLDYVWFAQTSSQNHFNNAARLQSNVYLKKLTFFTELQAMTFKERPSTAEFDFRIRRNERIFGAGVKYELSRSSLELRLGRDRFRYISDSEEGENIPDFENRVENNLRVTGRKKLLPKTTFLVEWEGRGISFDKPEGKPKDSQSRRISLGFDLDPSAFLRGSVKVGVENLDPDDPQQQGFHGLVGEGNLLYRMTGRTNLEGRGKRSTGFTIAPNNVYYVFTGYGATLTQFLTDRVAGEVGGDRQRVDYPELTTQLDLDTGVLVDGFRTDHLHSYFAGASYRFNNQARLGLRVGRWRRLSTFDFLDRRRNTAMVTYAYNF